MITTMSLGHKVKPHEEKNRHQFAKDSELDSYCSQKNTITNRR